MDMSPAYIDAVVTYLPHATLVFDRFHVIKIYNAHNERVQQLLPPEQLLVFDPSQGWDALCEFLEVPVPAEAYPKVNTREQFRSMLADRMDRS